MFEVEKHSGEFKEKTKRKMMNKFNLRMDELHDIYSFVYGNKPASVHTDDASSTNTRESSAKSKLNFFPYPQPWYFSLPSDTKEEITLILEQQFDRPHDCVHDIGKICNATIHERIELYKTFINKSGVFIDPVEVLFDSIQILK